MTLKTNLLATTTLSICLATASAAQDAPASAEDDVLKIGLIYTLSGPGAALGEQARNGFMLAADKIGEMGGMETEIVVIDDEQRPDKPRTTRANWCSVRTWTSWSGRSFRTS